MPVDYSQYPDDWHEISHRIRFDRADCRCECEGQCGYHAGRCEAINSIRTANKRLSIRQAEKLDELYEMWHNLI